MCVFKLWLDCKFLLCLKHEIVGCVSKNNNKKDVCVCIFLYVQYFNKSSFFNSWELMVKNPGIKCWTHKWEWYLKYWSWLEKF